MQGLSQLKYAMGDSSEMFFYWKKKCMESFKAVSAEQQWRKKLKPKKKKKEKKKKKNSWFEVGLYSSEANKVLQNEIFNKSTGNVSMCYIIKAYV